MSNLWTLFLKEWEVTVLCDIILDYVIIMSSGLVLALAQSGWMTSCAGEQSSLYIIVATGRQEHITVATMRMQESSVNVWWNLPDWNFLIKDSLGYSLIVVLIIKLGRGNGIRGPGGKVDLVKWIIELVFNMYCPPPLAPNTHTTKTVPPYPILLHSFPSLINILFYC